MRFAPRVLRPDLGYEFGSTVVATRTHLVAVDSTNSEVARRFQSSPHMPSWSLFTADHQTRGRGRYGRSWIDTSDALLASLFVRIPDHQLDWITALAGLAAARTLDDLYGDSLGPIQVKWPNDIIVNGRKVAGILTEHLGQCVARRGCNALVIGIGINFGHVDPTAGPRAGYLPIQTGHEEVLKHLIAHLRNLLDADPATWRRAYSERLIGKGQPTTILHVDDTLTEAVVVDVDDRAGLVVSSGDSLQTITCGDVALPDSNSPKEAR